MRVAARFRFVIAWDKCRRKQQLAANIRGSRPCQKRKDGAPTCVHGASQIKSLGHPPDKLISLFPTLTGLLVGRVARSYGDVCFPFRNCGCPALASFARAGTVPPLTWDLLCPAVCAASMALISCGKAGPVRVNAGWTKIPFRDRVA